MTPEALNAKLDDMIKDTKTKHLKWRLELETSEYETPDKKIKVNEEKKEWVMDECYVCFSCTFHGADFVLITYEDIETCEDKTRSMNLIFLPPVGMRLFDVNALAPYSIAASAALTAKIHTLWDLLLAMYKEDNTSVDLIVDEWTPDKGVKE